MNIKGRLLKINMNKNRKRQNVKKNYNTKKFTTLSLFQILILLIGSIIIILLYLNFKISDVYKKIESQNKAVKETMLSSPTPSFTTAPIPTYLPDKADNNGDGGLTQNQQTALAQIEIKQQYIRKEVDTRLASIRELLGNEVIDDPMKFADQFAKDPFKYIDKCNNTCLNLVGKLLNEIKELNAKYDELEILRLQIIGQK